MSTFLICDIYQMWHILSPEILLKTQLSSTVLLGTSETAAEPLRVICLILLPHYLKKIANNSSTH